MNTRTRGVTASAILLAAVLPLSAAHAQLDGLLKHGASAGSSGGLGNLGGLGGALSGQSITSGSAGNVAGLLEFCIKNNYLGGNQAAAVKNSLMSKLGGSAASDSAYGSGAKGILSSSDGSQIDLSGGGLKDKVTRQVCDQVLAQGKSLL